MTYSRLYGSQARPSSSQFTDWGMRLYYTKLKHLKNLRLSSFWQACQEKTGNSVLRVFKRIKELHATQSSLYPKMEISVQLPFKQLMKQEQWTISIGEKGSGRNHKVFITGCCGNQKLNGIQKRD